MAYPQVLEGTSEEIMTMLQGGAFAGRRMRVIIEPEEEDFTDQLPDPPNTVRDPPIWSSFYWKAYAAGLQHQ